jgi:hypothetical protein
VKVGFIGVTTTDTPYFLLSEYARQFNWTDLSDAVNRYVPSLERQGVEAIVVLAHAGAFQQGDEAAGEVVNEARQMSDAVDVVVAGHTHSRLDLEVDGKLVVEALSYGVAFDRVNITVDRATGDVVSKSALVMPTRHEGIKPDPDLLTLVESYRKRVAPLANRVIGYTDERLDNEAVDRVAVDAQRAFAGADIAFLNPGNTRSDIDAGPITYADAFEVQAYEHPVWRMHMLGADLIKTEAEQPELLVSGVTDLRPDAVYTVAANGIVAGPRPLRPRHRPRGGRQRPRGARGVAGARAALGLVLAEPLGARQHEHAADDEREQQQHARNDRERAVEREQQPRPQDEAGAGGELEAAHGRGLSSYTSRPLSARRNSQVSAGIRISMPRPVATSSATSVASGAAASWTVRSGGSR